MPKKQTKKTQKKFDIKRFLVIAVPALILGIAFLVYFFYPLVAIPYKSVVDNPSTLRESIIASIRELGRPAPVDARTGDVYFPEAGLYIPRGDTTLPEFSYSYDTYDVQGETHRDLVVTTSEAVEAGMINMYNAQNSDELFKAVPEAQSCARGVVVASAPLVDDEGYVDTGAYKLHHQQLLNDGATRYIYAATGCEGVKDIVKVMEGLQVY